MVGGASRILARKITTDPMNRTNPRFQYGIWPGMRNNSAECFIGNAGGVFRAREMRRLEPQDRWDAEAINNVIGVPWRMTDGRWTVDRPEAQVDPIPIPPLPFEGALVQRERIAKQDINEFGATIGCPGCNAIKDNKRAQAHSDRCRMLIEERLRTTAWSRETGQKSRSDERSTGRRSEKGRTEKGGEVTDQQPK